jgi:DNA polymerase-3 subunit delta'
VTAPESTALDRLAAEGRLPAVLLLTGSREGALEAEARRLAARLLCPEGEGDASCDSCRRVRAGIHPDLFLVAPEGVQIRIDKVREALQFAVGRPYEAARRVGIVARADRLGPESANAFLKALEEPGSRLHWILTTVVPEALLPTIRSRCTIARRKSPRAGGTEGPGLSPEDAGDRALLAGELEEGAAFDLEGAREVRAQTVAALEAGLAGGDLTALLAVADDLSRRERFGARLLTELLTDAALLGHPGAAEFVRHRAVAGRLAPLARAVRADLLRSAALRAAEVPPDNRRGNRRMHYESVLVGLWERRVNRES